MTAQGPARPLREMEILVTVALGAMLVPLNSTMMAVALPRLIDDFHSRLSVAAVTTFCLVPLAVSPSALPARP